MKVKKMDMRSGEVTLVPETLDDLWHLEKLLEPGDAVRALTFRKTVVKRGQDVSEGERKPVMLTIRLEKVSLQPGSLRLHGPIAEGPESVRLNSYHTIDAEPGRPLTIIKKWKGHHIERINRAKIKRPLLFICAIDRDGADFAVLRESGLEPAGSMAVKKGEDGDRAEFYGAVASFLESKDCYGTIILAGPGFERENLLKFIKRDKPALAGKIVLEHASCGGMAGIKEVVKSSAARILSETRMAREGTFVAELLKRIRMEGPAAYGRNETEKAVEMGAAETLLVSVDMVREFEELMEKAEKTGAKIVVISGDHELGGQLLQIGGIGALLRFRV